MGEQVAVKSGKLAFEGFRLDPANALLWRGKDRVALAPKPFEVLCRLVDRPGELVTKDELLDAVWSNLHVSESSLSVAIKAVRSALGDDPNAPRYIETVTRRGYRFIAPVTVVPPPEAERPPEGKASAPSFVAASRPHWWVGRAGPIETLENGLAVLSLPVTRATRCQTQGSPASAAGQCARMREKRSSSPLAWRVRRR
jgi:DNA-binding winged helix-turn-helix (wHTH) protein